MKKFTCILLALLFTMCFSACERSDGSGIAASEIMAKIKDTARFGNPKEDDLSDPEIARKYGISPDSLKEGFVYSDSDEGNVDLVILAVANSNNNVPKIESALSAEKVKLSNAWENDEGMKDKVRESVLKSRGNYVILIVSNDSKSLEQIFDDLT